jgi:hypothetical protein
MPSIRLLPSSSLVRGGIGVGTIGGEVTAFMVDRQRAAKSIRPGEARWSLQEWRIKRATLAR